MAKQLTVHGPDLAAGTDELTATCKGLDRRLDGDRSRTRSPISTGSEWGPAVPHMRTLAFRA